MIAFIQSLFYFPFSTYILYFSSILRFLSFLYASVHCGAYTENTNGFDSNQLGRKRVDWYLGKTKLYLRNFLTLKFAARRLNIEE